MAKTAEVFVGMLVKAGIKRVYGVAGDSLNGITDAIRATDGIDWMMMRHEEVAAFAAGAEAAMTDELTVCAGSCGPGNLHLINGLHDCHRSRVPVLAIAAQVPSAEMGSNYFQETKPEQLFMTCSDYCEVVTQVEQMPRVLAIAMRTAIAKRCVAVVVIPGDVLTRECKSEAIELGIDGPVGSVLPPQDALGRAVEMLNKAKKVTILAGAGCADAREEVLEAAKALQAPMVIPLRGKEYLEYDNPYFVGPNGLIGMTSGHYGLRKRSADREKSIVEGIRDEMGSSFVREVDGNLVSRWYENLTSKRGLSPGTAVRHFNVMHHMMEKACTIWSKETGIERNPADEVEVRRPDDARDRYLSDEELRRLKLALDEKKYRKGTKDLNITNYRMRLVVLIALTTGMRSSEIYSLRWSDVMYSEGLLAVRSKLKGGKMRYVPMVPELAEEMRHTPVVISDDRIFPPRNGEGRGRQRLEGSFDDLLERAKIEGLRFHDLRHTFASWYMMNGGDLYELAKILGHSNIKMTERYAKLGRQHIARTGNTTREMWKLLEPANENAMFAYSSHG